MKSIMHLRWVQKAIHLILVCAMVLTPMGQIMPVVQAESGETAPREESALSLLGISSDPVGLKDLPAGSLLQFAGYDWIVLNPANGMLIMQSSYSEPVPFDTSMPGGNVYFNPGSPSNIGYLLNTTFFNSLSALDQSRIRTVTWEIGPQGREWDHIMDAKVGLLNWNQVQTEPVASQLQSFLADSWLLTWYAVDADASWWASGLSGNYYLGADLLPAVETDYSEGHEVHPVIYLSPNTPTLSGAVIPPQNEILSFSVPNQRGESSFDTETSTITFTVTDSVNLTSIIPLISLSSGATSQPANGVVTDLSNPTTCTVRSADGFEKVWVLVARVLSTRTDISEFSVSEMMLVSEENYAIINRDRHTVHFLVPADTDITQLTPSIFAGMEATLSPLSGTPQDFTSPITYRVTAEAGNTQDWVVTCVRVGDNVPYTVEHYQQDLVGLGYTLNNTQTLSGILSSEVTATVQSASGFVENTTQSNRITSGTTLLDGSLTLRLYYDRTLHSVTYEEDGGSNIPDLTSLRYGSQLTTPQTPVKTGYQFLGWFTDAERTQAASFPMNLTGNKTFYAKWQSTLGAPGDITGFTVRNQIGNSTITRSDWWNSIDLVMPIGSDLRAIAPVITTVAGTTISPASGEVRDFSGSDQYPVEYAADYGGEYPVTWNVRVTIEEQPLNILTFTVPGQLGNTIINPIDHTVKFVMPSGSDVTALRPLVTVPSGNGVYTGFWWGAQNYYSPSAVDAEDFSYSVEFHVIGSDSLEQTWTATCIIQSETAGYISSFTVPNQVGNSFLDMVNHRVVFHMPYGSDATNLQPTITVPAGSTLQPLAESVRNYSGLVYFNVTAPGGTPELWTVQCIVDLNAEKSITDVTLENQKSIIVDDSQHTIVLSMPVGTDITSLAPQFQISAAAEIFPASGTPKNFTSPQKYLVYAEDGTSQLWTVSVVMLGNVTVEHYQMMPAGNWYGVERSNYYYDRIPGSTFTAESAEFTGFIENTSHTSRIPSGTVQAGQTLTLKLYYDRLPYTVQFVENGGSEIDDLSNVLYGTWPTRPTPPVKAGYQLENWYTDPELTNAYQFNVDITQDLILYAKWEVAPPVLSPSGGMYAPGITVTADKDCFYTTDGSDPRFAGTLLLVGEIITVDQSVLIKATSYFNREFSPVQEVAYEINTTKKTVTFESNHGSAVASQEIAYGHSAVLPPTPTQYGYTFVRWCSDFWLSQAYDFSSIVQEDITLYAQWVIGTYTLSFDTQGGSTIEPITAWFGTYLDAPAPPTKTGYTFKQWNPVFQEYMSMPGEDTTLTAEWTTNQYTLHFNTAGGTSVADQLQTWNLPITAPAAPTKTGYTFSGWSPAIPDLMPMQDFTVTAQWTAKQYTITFDSDGGSAVSAITQDYGTPLVSPENPTKMGYEFGGWTPYLPATMPAENLTLTAYWGANFYTITLNTNGGNLIDPIRREVNTDLVAPADPQRAGYTFLGWDPVFPTKMPAENLTLVAQWQANSITLQFDSAGGSTVASIVQNCDTNLTPPANPSRTGYTFNTWSPVLPAKIPTANQTYTAIWNINSYTISFDTVGGSEIESITEPYNTTLSQPTNPTRTGYQFTSWLPSFPAKMPAENLSLVAQWSPNIYTIIFDSKGGSAVAPLSQEYLKAIVKPTDPSKAGYSFIGWYTNTENTIEYDFATPMSNDLTLYAGWQIQNYRVIFRNWNGELLSEEIVQYLGAATPPVVPDREPTAQYYFAFYGWNGNPNSILGETTFTAVFLEDLRSYTVYYLDTTGVEITTQTIDYDDWAYEPQQPYREGLTFMGWFQESTLLNEVEFPVLIQGDVTYYASFKRPDNEILSFSLANQVGDTSIHSYYGTVSLLVPWHTDRTQLVPTITVSPGAQVSPASGVATDLSNGKNYTVTAEDGSQKQWLVSVNEAESPNEIESFKVSGQNGESIIDPVARTVVFHMPFGSDVTAVRPEVRLTYGAYSNIGWYPNINYGGRDPVDFTDQVKYTVITDQQGSNSYWQEWYVTCVIDPNTANDFTAFSVEHQVGNSEINATERTILFHVPYGTDVTNLQPQWTLSANATVSVGASTRDFSQPVSMTMRSESGAEQVWQITCIVNLNRANDILQFAVANQVGSSQIDAENHTIVFHMLYGTQVTALSPEISISEQASVTPASASARDFTESQVYQVTSQSLEAQNWTVTCVVDPNRENKIISLVVPGQIGQTMWDENQSAYIFHMPYGTNIRQLTPALTISIEATVTPTSRTPLDFSQAQTYTVTAQGGEVQAWTVKCVVDPNRANDILTLSIDLQVGESFIDANLHTVLFHMPYGTDITTLRPTYTLSERASGNPLSGATRDFTNPVIYAILSDSQELQNWTVTCIVDPNTENKILGFSIPGQAGSSVIDATAHTVTLSVPYGTMIRDVLPTMTVSAEATLRPGSSEVVNLRQPVLYTVTSQSGASQTWTVTCNVLPNTQKNIEQFTVPGQIGDTVIDQANQTVRFEMPYITPVTALTPSLVLSAEATVTPASLTSVDFTQPQTYTVTAQDNSQQIWTVTCIRRNTANDIISFRVAGQVGSTQIDTINHTVIFYLLPGSPVGSITPTLECSPGASVLPVSGRTQDFSSPIPYTVTAENGTPQIWTAAYRIYYEPEEEVAPPPKPPTPPEEQPLKPQELIEKAAPLKTTFVQVSTDSASGITSKTATLSARIIAGGGDLRVGFRYRQAGQADWLYTGTSAQNIAIGGSFSTTLTDLLPGTDYEGEARAANSFGLGEGGITSWKTLAAAAPKVATYEAINLLLSQATLTGTVLDDGGSLITSTGFQWGFNQDSLEEVSTGITKQLQTTISDLKPGQKLIYRAFATNTVATTYGSWQTITVPGLVVTTLKPTQITRSSATLQGQILGTSKILESGFSISPGDVSQILATADAQGSFSVNLQNLKADTKYYYTAYAKTSVGEFRGEIQELIPVNDFPVVETFEATDMTQVLANIGGYIVKNSGYKITDSGFVWGMDPNPDQKISVGPGEDLRTLQYKLVGLKGNTTYYYRAYATNEKGTGYGKTLQFVTTKALKPTVVTQSVSFDHDSWQWVLVGNVSNNGGVPLVEYGFRVSSNQTEWAQLVVGFDVQGDYISRGLQFMDELTSGEYFLRAYAMNPGGMGEGETITFKVPTKPSVIASVDAESIILDHLTLIGSITDTGGPEISCVTTQFKIRKTGESEWTIQGVAQGLFEADDFSFDATALTPGAKYELMAEARNQIGWGSSPIVSFMMNYGKTDRDAVTYLKKQGKTATEIATILKAYYQDTPEAAFAALQFAEFSLSEITNAMKTSTYATNFRNMATLIKKAEFEAVAMAKVMLEYYPLDLSLTAGGHPKVGMLLLLKANGYTPTDLAKVCLEVYQYDVASTVSELRSGGFYSQNEAYLAAFNVYGLDATVQFLWAQAMNFIQRTGQGQMFQVLYEMVDILRNIAKLSVTDAAITLQKLYPTLKPEQLADAYYSAKQSVSQTGEAVRYLFGNNLTEVARALEQTPFKEEQINDYLIKELGATALEMVPIVVNIYRHWMDPKEGCAIIFKTYFNLNAIESAKVLYAAGWTENVVDHPGYGLGNLIWTMKLHFGYTTNAQLIEVFKALGLSPMEVAKRLVSNSGWQWLPAYRLGGYTATDAAAWLKLDWSKYGRRTQIIQTIKMCYEAGYDIADIATALIFHYDLDIAESMVFFVDYTGLSTTVIKEALTKAYGKDPLQSAIEKMKGQPLENILSTLKDTYEIKDPVEVTNLLVKLGYPREAIFEKMIWTYFKSFNQREHLEAFTAYLQLVDSELNRKDAMNAFLRRNNLPEGPEYAGSFLRNSARYSMSEIAEILHTEYQVTLSEALKAFFDTYGAGQEIVYYPFVIKAYGMDMSSYTKYQRNRGISAATSTKELVDIFKITDKIEIANILYKSGYNKEAIQQGFMEAFFRGFISPDVIALMNELNERVFKQGLNAQIETITQKGALQPVSAAIAKLHAAGISLTDMVRALKDLYALSQKEAFTAMTTANIFSYEEVANGVQLVYGGDFVVALIGMWRSKSYGTAEYCFRELERSSGIADRAVIYRYLRMGGFTEEEVAVALYWAAREDMLVTLKEVYDIKSSIELGQKLKQLLGELTNRFYSTTLASYLVSLFPQTTNYEIVQTFLAIGKKVHQDGTDSITGWLRSYANTGKRDARLAGYLGKNNNGLNLEVHTAVEVLQKIGYNVQDTTYYALKCGFTWSQFFKHLIYRYAPENFPTSYYDNNSSSKFVVGYLKPYYSILDIAEGLFGFHQSSGRVLADLISAGLSVEEATYATLWQGGEAAASMVVSLVDNSIGRANAARDQSLRLNAVSATEIVFYNSLAVAYDRKVAGLPYNDPITLEDIAKSLVKYGPGAQYGSNSQYFNHWEVLTAMQNVTRIYLELAKVDMPYTEIALATLRLAGLAVSDAAEMMAQHNVGLSTASIFKAVFGLGFDWFEAVKILAGSGYSFGDSISAVIGNHAYKTVIGIGVLSAITTSAMSSLSSIASLSTYVNYVKQAAVLGFMIGTNASVTDILLHLPNFYLGFAGRLAYAGGRIGYTYIPGAP